MSNLRNRSHYYFVYAVGLFTFLPINYLPQLFDGVFIDYAFAIGNISSIDLWYREASRYGHLLVIYIVDYLVRYTSLPAELLLDNILVVILILFCLEVRKYSSLFFGLQKKWANWAALFTALFPVWHLLADFDIGQYLISIYCLFIGFRLFVGKHLLKNLVGAALIYLSFNVESNLAMVLGLTVLALAVKGTKSQLVFPIQKVCVLMLLFSLYITIRALYIPPSGFHEGYLSVNADSWGSIWNLIKNVSKYLSFFLFFTWLPLAYIFQLSVQNREYHFSRGKNKLIDWDVISTKNYLLLIMLFGFAVAPYLLLDASTSIINLTDYTQRHAFLLAPISGIWFATLFKDMVAVNCLHKRLDIRTYLVIFICMNVLLLSYGVYRKIETAQFRKNLIYELQTYGSIPEGNVQLVGKNIPGALRRMEISHLFYQAYNVAGWLRLPNDEIFLNKIKSNKTYLSLFILDEYVPGCNIHVYLKNFLGKYERIFKAYIINYKKYYKIDNIVIEC